MVMRLIARFRNVSVGCRWHEAAPHQTMISCFTGMN